MDNGSVNGLEVGGMKEKASRKLPVRITWNKQRSIHVIKVQVLGITVNQL